MKYVKNEPYIEEPADMDRVREDFFKSKLFEHFSDAMMALSVFYRYNDYTEHVDKYILRVLDTASFVSERMKEVKTLCIEEKCRD